MEIASLKGRTIKQPPEYKHATTTLIAGDNDVLLLPGAIKLFFPSTFLKVALDSAPVYMCASASVFNALKQERFRGKPRTNTTGEKSETVYKAGRELSASQPGGNQLWASSGNIQGSLTHIPEGKGD